MRLTGDGGEDHQIAGTDQLFGTVVHRDPGDGARLLQVTAEAGRAVGGQVVHADLVERPAGSGQEQVDVAGDQTRRRRTRRVSGAAGRG